MRTRRRILMETLRKRRVRPGMSWNGRQPTQTGSMVENQKARKKEGAARSRPSVSLVHHHNVVVAAASIIRHQGVAAVASLAHHQTVVAPREGSQRSRSSGDWYPMVASLGCVCLKF
jgi:hypothetical protein